MSSPEKIIADAFNTEIVGHSGDYNGGRLTYSRSLDLAIQGLAALRGARYEIVQLPEADETIPATEDEHGIQQWWIDADVVAAFDSGVVEFGFAQYHGTDTQRLRVLAAALLAAADTAEANQ